MVSIIIVPRSTWVEFTDIFVVPIVDQYLLYAPLHRYARVVNRADMFQIRRSLHGEAVQLDPGLAAIASQPASAQPALTPTPQGAITAPLFLGLITTHDCNMGCRYCGFSTPKNARLTMPVELAKTAIDRYLDILQHSGAHFGEIQFFGGEPFFNNRVVEFSVGYARSAAAKKGIEVRFEVTTNGLLSPERAEWVADHFGAVVLSFDGLAEAHNRTRPLRGGQDSFERVFKTAKILSEGSADLIIRACVTAESAGQMPAMAEWAARQLIPSAVCFEPLTPSEVSARHGLMPPEPVAFAKYFCQAEDILAGYGIKTVTSGTDLDRLQRSYCPVGKDVIIVTPDGAVNACYLNEESWLSAGLDFHFGRITSDPPQLEINDQNLSVIRAMDGSHNALCSACLCKYHCAGGCHISHRAVQQADQYDNICIQTRLITIAKLLKKIGAQDLYQRWLSSLDTQQDFSASRPSDHLQQVPA
jgi:uncharacterized protein